MTDSPSYALSSVSDAKTKVNSVKPIWAIAIESVDSNTTAEPVLKLLISQLTVYMEASAAAEEYAECVEFLLNKAETYLNVKDEELLANL